MERINFLQQFQTGLLHDEVCGEAATGLDNDEFDPTLDATGDAIIEPGLQSVHGYR